MYKTGKLWNWLVQLAKVLYCDVIRSWGGLRRLERVWGKGSGAEKYHEGLASWRAIQVKMTSPS